VAPCECLSVARWSFAVCDGHNGPENPGEAAFDFRKAGGNRAVGPTIAHEINNPLEAVFNLIYLARTSRTDIEKIRDTWRRRSGRSPGYLTLRDTRWGSTATARSGKPSSCRR